MSTQRMEEINMSKEVIQKGDNKKLKYRRTTIIFFLLIIVIIIFFFLLLFTLLFLILSNNNESERIHDKQSFQYSSISNNRTTYGISQLHKNLEDGEYLSYYNEETQSTIFISNFGGEEYECTGSCYCDDDLANKRKTAVSHTFTKGLVVVLSAFSLTVAIEMAKESFHNSCEEKLRGICDTFKIKSDVDVCMHLRAEDITMKTKDEIFPKNEDGVRGELHKYHCKGYCITGADTFRSEKLYKVWDEDIVDCPKYEMEGYVTVDIYYNDELGMPYNAYKFIHRARRKFLLMYFQQFCIESSSIGLLDGCEKAPAGKDYNLCFGGDIHRELHNIVCNKMTVMEDDADYNFDDIFDIG